MKINHAIIVPANVIVFGGKASPIHVKICGDYENEFKIKSYKKTSTGIIVRVNKDNDSIN